MYRAFDSVKTELLYGIHPVYEALMANRRVVLEIYFQQQKPSKSMDPIMAAAAANGIASKTVRASDFNALVGRGEHQGVAAKVGPYPLAALSDLLAKAKSGDGNHFLLMLDSVMDPQNLGAILRTALCTGIDGVIIPKDRSAPPTPAVSRASAGALEHILLARVPNLVQVTKHLKENGVWIFGLEKGLHQSIFASDLTGSMAIVVGGEQRGIRPLLKKNCDFLVSIPQQGPLDSLNASVAGAIALYETYRQRRPSLR
jgi:23S rRNA (guanosine2251-2'-O)-methyltransferase